MSVQSGPNGIESGLVLHLDAANSKSFANTGNTWTDMSGLGNNGTLVGGAAYNSGNAGTFSFDGVNDCVNCGNAASLDIRRTMTLEAWFKVNSFSFASGWSNIINKMNAAGDSNTRTYAAWLNSSQYIHFTTADSTGQQDFNTSAILVANRWHHWVGIIDRTNGNVFQYIDGNLNTNGYTILANVGNVKFGGNIQINNTAVAPTAVAGATVVYAATPGAGASGVYVVNGEAVNEELITKKRAFAFSILL